MIQLRHIVLPEVASTNDLAATWVLEKKIVSNTLLVAQNQTKGRGQASNSWYSEEGKSLTVSFVFFPPYLQAKNQFAMSQAISLGIAKFLRTHVEEVKVKWPNDLLVGDKKIAGILIEHAIIGTHIAHAICGMGININLTRFEGDYLATSLTQETGETYDLAILLKDLEQCVLHYYQMIEKQEFETLDKAYHCNLYKQGKEMLFEDGKGKFEAIVVGVNEYGQLRLLARDEKTERIYNFKEVRRIEKN